jgi:hypothetical protein
MSQNFALDIGNERLAASSGRESLDIGCAQVVQETGSIRSLDLEQGPVADVSEADIRGQSCMLVV